MNGTGAEYTISSTPVRYPYKAYPSQISMIDRVVKALQRNQSCLIESPTGSGKSMALLCSVLAWRRYEYDRIEKEFMTAWTSNIANVTVCYDEKSNAKRSPNGTPGGVEEQRFLEYSDENCFVDSATPVPPKKQQANDDSLQQLTEEQIRDKIWEARKRIPKIYFGTRTHKQLSQLIRELKRTEYSNVKMTILAGRDQTCINEHVRSKPDRSEACRQLLNPATNFVTGSCPYYTRWKKQYQKPYLLRTLLRKELLVSGTNAESWDIEDVVKVCSKHKVCPHFSLTNTLLIDAELIFCPYNYLIDPVIRNKVGLDLKEQIVIFDEAHNIEDACREASSFIFTTAEVRQAQKDFETAAKCQQYGALEAAKFFEKASLRLMLWMYNTAKSNDMKVQSDGTQYCEWQGTQFMTVLAKLELLPEVEAQINEALSAIRALDDEEYYSGNDSREESGDAAHISTQALNLMEKLMCLLRYFYHTDPIDYSICLKREYSSGGAGAHQSLAEVSLQFWCMNPATAFGDIGLVAKSVILASGTLAPMKTFEVELGVPFKLQLEATHVLPKDRMFVASFARGPSGRQLRVTYQNVEEWGFQDELGDLIVEICSVVPRGVLCFFPSYKLLEKVRDRWFSTDIWRRLSAKKLIIVEPKLGEQLTETMRQFEEAVKNPSDFGLCCTGAIFLAVCRGKVSEGLDFADDHARAVITVGIPYPNVNGFDVSHKRNYNDERVRMAKGTLPGHQWYEIQAFRALNQALGRCLRHRNDWGALILIDERFGGRDSQRYCSNLSKWIRENIRHYSKFDDAKQQLTEFTEKFISEQMAASPVSTDAADSCCSSASVSTPILSESLPFQGGGIKRRLGSAFPRSHRSIDSVASPYFSTGKQNDFGFPP